MVPDQGTAESSEVECERLNTGTRGDEMFEAPTSPSSLIIAFPRSLILSKVIETSKVWYKIKFVYR